MIWPVINIFFYHIEQEKQKNIIHRLPIIYDELSDFRIRSLFSYILWNTGNKSNVIEKQFESFTKRLIITFEKRIQQLFFFEFIHSHTIQKIVNALYWTIASSRQKRRKRLNAAIFQSSSPIIIDNSVRANTNYLLIVYMTRQRHQIKTVRVTLIVDKRTVDFLFFFYPQPTDKYIWQWRKESTQTCLDNIVIGKR